MKINKQPTIQRDFAELLGWGYITVHRYENGSLPSESHAAVLSALKNNPMYSLGLLETTKSNFKENEVARLKEKIISIGKHKKGICFFEEAEKPEINVYTGFKPFSFNKLKELILYFANFDADLLKTKLLKLLWYTDFLHYKRHAVGITGTIYIHLPLGPVPDNYSYLLGNLQKAGFIDIEPFIKGNHVGELIKPFKNYNDSSFTSDELDTLNDVLKKFRSWGSKQISNYSHKEEGYEKTVKGERISYCFAENLSLI